jgi:hypothetical protein
VALGLDVGVALGQDVGVALGLDVGVALGEGKGIEKEPAKDTVDSDRLRPSTRA